MMVITLFDAGGLMLDARPWTGTPLSLFADHSDYLRSATADELARELAAPDRLRLARAQHGRRLIEVA